MLGFSPIASSPLGAAGGTAAILLATDAQDSSSVSLNSVTNVSIAATEAKDISAINCSVFWAVSLAATDTKDAAAIAFDILGYVYLLTTEAPDTASFNASNYNLELIATEATDTAVFNASISSTLSMAATEAPDSYSQKAYILWLTPDQPDDPSIWVPKNDPTPYLTTVI